MSRTHKEEQNDHEWELAAWELLSEAKATAEHWMEKTKQAEQAAADLKAEVEDWKKAYADIEQELKSERFLADNLGDSLLSTLSSWVMSDNSEQAAKDLAAWKEARGE